MVSVGSLFSGIGGIDLGFLQAGFYIAWANEIDKDACKTYRHNFPKTHLLEQDITQVDPTELTSVDVLVAGFPCQSFSVCGNKKGFDDKRGNLFFEIMRFVDALHPEVIFLENVANLVEHDCGRTFNVIHNELSERDYYIRYLVADACDYGIPQHRTRTYIVAFRNFAACNRFAFPQPQPLEKHIFDVIDKTTRATDGYYLATESPSYNRLNNFIKDDGQIYRFSDYGIQAGRDGVSFTLKANMGTWRERVPYIRDAYGIRKITPLECLALQGFPTEFTFPGIPVRSAYKQCGNSVVVPIIRRIAENIRHAMFNNNYIHSRTMT